METKMELKQALVELRKNEKKKFDQSIDLLISLKDIDLRKDNVSLIASIPNSFKEKKVCAFLEKKSELVKTITNLDFAKYKEKKELKNLVKDYDFFIASAKLMPSVATTFGKALGPTGKMPSPQLGVLMQADDSAIVSLLEKIKHAVKIRVKEPSIKVSVGKESMSDDKILANIHAIYTGVVNALPNKKENIRTVMLKLTMSKPIKVEVK